MCSSKQLAPTLILLLLAGACSSSKKSQGKDASPDIGGDGRSLDTGTINKDGGQDLGADAVRDSAKDLAVDMAKDAIGNKDTEKDVVTKEDGGKEIDAPVDGSRDVIEDGARDATKDYALDVTKDSTRDNGRLDVVGEVPVNVCSTYTLIPMDVAHSDVKLTTVGSTHNFDLPCTPGGADAIAAFVLGQRELVYADTFGTAWNTVLSFSKACPFVPLEDTQIPEGVACSDDACGTSQSQIVALLDPGSYFIIVSGANGQSGEVTLHFQHAQIGNGPLVALPAGTGSLTGTTSGKGKMVDVCEAPGPENSYWWLSCPDYAGGAFAASTCTGTSFDTMLALQIPRTNNITCVDNTEPCGTRSSMSTTIPAGAGLNLMSVAGGGSIFALGSYQVTYTRP